MEEDELKLKELQAYVPFLERMIEKSKEKDQNKFLQLQKLYKLITNKEKKLSLDTLKNCEKVIVRLYESWIKLKSSSDSEKSTIETDQPLNEAYKEYSAPASPQENWNNIDKFHKPIRIPTERKDATKYYDRNRNKNISNDNTELYKRRSPSRYNDYNHKINRYDTNQYIDSKKLPSHTVTSEQCREKLKENSINSNISGDQSISNLSVFDRLGEKIDINSKQYENLKISIVRDKSESNPIADVLKSPPLSLNDIHDLMNESEKDSEKHHEKNESNPRESNKMKDQWKNLKDLELARKKLGKVEIKKPSDELYKRKHDLKPTIDGNKDESNTNKEECSFIKSKEKCKLSESNLDLSENKAKISAEKFENVSKTVKETPTITKPESGSVQNQHDSTRLAYKYNPHRRKNSDSLPRSEEVVRSDPRLNIPSHNTLPTINPSDPRLKSRSFTPRIPQQTLPPSLLDIPIAHPFAQNLPINSRTPLTTASSMAAQDLDRNFFMTNVSPTAISQPLISNSVTSNSIAYPSTSNSSSFCSKFRPAYYDQVVKQKYFESKQNKNEALTYREHRKALEAKRQNEKTNKVSEVSNTQQKSVLDSMYRNSDWKGELSHISSKFKIPKLNKVSEHQKDKKNKIEEKSSNKTVANHENQCQNKEKQNITEKKPKTAVANDEENWDDDDDDIDTAQKSDNHSEKHKTSQSNEDESWDDNDDIVWKSDNHSKQHKTSQSNTDENWDDDDDIMQKSDNHSEKHKTSPSNKDESWDDDDDIVRKRPNQSEKHKTSQSNTEENWDDDDDIMQKSDNHSEKHKTSPSNKDESWDDDVDIVRKRPNQSETQIKSKCDEHKKEIKENTTLKKSKNKKMKTEKKTTEYKLNEKIEETNKGTLKGEDSKLNEEKEENNEYKIKDKNETSDSKDQTSLEVESQELTKDVENTKVEENDCNITSADTSWTERQSRIHSRRQTIPSYVYIEVNESEIDDDKSVISAKNIIEGKRERKTRTSFQPEKKQSVSPSISKSPSSVKSSSSAKSKTERANQSVSPSISKSISPTKSTTSIESIPSKIHSSKSKAEKCKKGSKKPSKRISLDSITSDNSAANNDQIDLISSTTNTTSNEKSITIQTQNEPKKKEETTTPTPTPTTTTKTNILEASSLVDLLNPSLLNKENVLGLLERVLDKEAFVQIKPILEKNESTNKTDEKNNIDENKSDIVETEHNDQENELKSSVVPSTSITQRSKPHKTELDRLNEDIRDMFISKDVVTATGRRSCTIKDKQKKKTDQIEQNQMKLSPVKSKISPKISKLNKIKKPKTAAGRLSSQRKFSKIKQPKITIRKACLDELKKRQEFNLQTISLIDSDSDDDDDGDDDDIDYKKMPVLKPISKSDDEDDQLELSKLQDNDRKLKNKPCPKSKKLFYDEVQSEDDENDMIDALPKLKIINNTEKDNTRKRGRLAKKFKKRGRPPIITYNITSDSLKNINADMHSDSIFLKKCVLCKAADGRSSHYINVHQGAENYISRLPPDNLANLRNPKTNVIARITRKNKVCLFEYQCPFCNRIQSISRNDWWNHIGMHTGEYAYQCSDCKRTFSVLSATRNHINKHCKEATAINLKKLNKDNRKNITSYVCDICNYIQTSEENIKKHLRTQHDMANDENLLARRMSQIVLMEFEDLPISNDKKLGKKKINKKNIENTENSTENNIEAFIPKENVDLNLDSNLLKYMSEISFKSSSPNNDVSLQDSSKSSKSIVDQLSMKFNSNQNSDIQIHSIFSDMSMVDQLSEKFTQDHSLESNENESTTVSSASMQLNNDDNLDMEEVNDENNLNSTSNDTRNKDHQTSIETTTNTNNQTFLKSWEQRYSQQISDGGISLANEFNKCVPTADTSQTVSSPFVDKISQRISKRVLSEEKDDDAECDPKIKKTTTTDQLKNSTSDQRDQNQKEEDNASSSTAECVQKDENPLQEKNCLNSNENIKLCDGIKTKNTEVIDIDSSFEDQLIIDERDESSIISVENRISEKEKLTEVENNETISGGDKSNLPNENDKINEDKGEGNNDDEDDDDDDNWEDIEEIITTKNPISRESSKNKTIFDTLSRLVAVVPSKLTKTGSTKKNDQKLLPDVKKTRTKLPKVLETNNTTTGSQSKPGIFYIDKRIPVKPEKEPSSSAQDDTSTSFALGEQFENFIPIQIDDKLPDIILSDEIAIHEKKNESLQNNDNNHSISTVSNLTLNNIIKESKQYVQSSLIKCVQQNSKSPAIEIVTNEQQNKLPTTMTATATTTLTKKISSIGFSKSSLLNSDLKSDLNSNVKYMCLVKNCSFLYSNSSVGLESHFEFEHPNYRWNGYCHCCETKVYLSENPNIELSKEIQHMIEVHLKNHISRSSTTLKSLVANKNLNSSSNTSSNEPKIKIRRLSGDQLSSSPSKSITSTTTIDSNSSSIIEQQQQNKPKIHNHISNIPESSSGIVHFRLANTDKQFSMTTPINQQQHHDKKMNFSILNPNLNSNSNSNPNNQSNKIVVNHEESIDKTAEQQQQKPSKEGSSNSSNNHNILLSNSNLYLIKSLKPWLMKSISKKSLQNIQNLLNEKSLYCFYKCMGDNCDFRSNNSSRMRIHLFFHSKSTSSVILNNKSYFECSYCDFVALNVDIYFNHMQTHLKDIYQCSYCFYRSCESYNVLLHLQNCHSYSEVKILQCFGQPKKFNREHDAKLLVKNVKPITCFECKQIFFIINSFCSHLSKHYQNKTHYICGFCEKFVEKRIAASHLLNEHSIGQFECIYCSYATDTETTLMQHLSQKHPSNSMLGCRRIKINNINNVEKENTNETIKIHTAILNCGRNAVVDSTIHECPFTESELDIIESKEITKNIEIERLKTLKPSSSSSSSSTLLTTVAVADDDVDQVSPISITTTNIEEISPAASNKLVSPSIKLNQIESIKLNSADKLSSVVNQTINQSSKSNRSEASIRMQENCPSISESTSSLEPNLNSNSKQNNKNDRNTTIEKRMSNENTEINGTTELNIFEKAAREIVKDTGLEGENLYKCGFFGCEESVPDASKFGDHIFKHSSANSDFNCYHCKQILKSVTELKSHYRTHALHRYFCYFCNYTSALASDISKHMNISHSKFNFVTYPLVKCKNDKSKDFFVICPKGTEPIDIVRYGERMIRTVERNKTFEKRCFGPQEIEQLPPKSIFFKELYCDICNYKTKVRINMVRHLEDHKNAVNVANVDPINPVPCLSTNEKHFDKMVNLALSSNISTTSTVTKPSDLKLPEYMNESKRYVCGALKCSYLSLDVHLLKHHLSTLHLSEKTYTCPHCQYEVCKKGVIVEKILQHMKYHDVRLFVCDKCNYMHYQKNVVERHISDKHPMENVTFTFYERSETSVSKSTISVSAKVSTSPESTSNSAAESKQWECALCKTRTVTKNQMSFHANKMHGNKHQFKCGHCEYGASLVKSIREHIDAQHKTKIEDVREMFYKLCERKQQEQKQNQDITPLWKRDSNKVKNIRGILMEEDEGSSQQQGEELNENKATYKKPQPRPRCASRFYSLSGTPKSLLSASASTSATAIKKIQLIQSVPQLSSPTIVSNLEIEENERSSQQQNEESNKKKPTNKNPQPQPRCASRVYSLSGTPKSLLSSSSASTSATAIKKIQPIQSVPQLSPPTIVSNLEIEEDERSSQQQNEESNKKKPTNKNPQPQPRCFSRFFSMSEAPTSSSSSSSALISNLKNPEYPQLLSLTPLINMDKLTEAFNVPFYTCKRYNCSYLAETQIELDDHTENFNHIELFMSLDKNLIFLCTKCSHITSNMESLLRHWVSKHWSVKIRKDISFRTPDDPFWFKVSSKVKCARCSYEGICSEVTKHHQVQHSEMSLALIDIKNPNQCSQCSFEFTNLNALSQHFIKSHKFLDNPFKNVNDKFLNEISKFGRIQCYIHCLYCHSIFVDKFNYVHHHSENHQNQNEGKYKILRNIILYRCPICPYTTTKENEQYLHITQAHPKNNPQYDKMKIIFQNGFMLEKYQTKNLTILTEMTSISSLPSSSKQNQQNSLQHKTSNLISILKKNTAKPATSTTLLSKTLSTSSSSSSPTTESIKNISLNKLIKRRKSIACYPSLKQNSDNNNDDNDYDNDDDDDTGNEGDDKNDHDWKPFHKKKRAKSLKLREKRSSIEDKNNTKTLETLQITETIEIEPFSFYGKETKKIDLSKINTKMNVGNVEVPITCEKFLEILNKVPTIVVTPLSSDQLLKLSSCVSSSNNSRKRKLSSSNNDGDDDDEDSRSSCDKISKITN